MKETKQQKREKLAREIFISIVTKSDWGLVNQSGAAERAAAKFYP